MKKIPKQNFIKTEKMVNMGKIENYNFKLKKIKILI